MLLLARNLLKTEVIAENYRTLLCTLNLDLFANRKTYLEDWVSETQFKIEYFCILFVPKRAWNNPWVSQLPYHFGQVSFFKNVF